MALPTPDRELLLSSATGNETFSSGVIVKGSFWFVYERYQTLSLREYDGGHFPNIREAVPVFHMSQALDSGSNIITDRFWLWEVTTAGELNLVEIEPFSDQSPVIHSVTNIESSVENVRVDVIDGKAVRIYMLKTGTPKEQWLYVYNDVKTGVPDVTTQLNWTATRLDNYDSVVDSTDFSSFQLMYSDTSSPPNIYTLDYTLTVPQIIGGVQVDPLMNVSWDTVTGGEQYRLQRTINDPTFSPANIHAVYDGTNTSTTDFLTPYDTTYYYRVKLEMPSLSTESAWSTIVGVPVTGVPIIYIHNVTELQYVGTVWPSDATYELANDIDASATIGWNGGAGFVPIPPFTGSFNGAGYTISDLYINIPSGWGYRAIFSEITSSPFSNVTVADATIGASGNHSILIGRASGTVSVTDCHVSGSINGTGGQNGGLIGYANVNNIDITNCSANVTITGGTQNGGIAYYLYGTDNTVSNCNVDLTIINGEGPFGGISQYVSNSTMTDCTSVVDIEINSSTSQSGGFTGSTYNCNFTNCHVSGNVTCNSYVNTFGGFSAYTYDSPMNNCSANIDYTGTGDTNQVAGFAGYLSSCDRVSNCFSEGSINIDVDGTDTAGYIAGFACYTHKDMSNCYSTVDITIDSSSFWSSNYVGGFISYVSMNSGDAISNCYATGDINISSDISSGISYAGGFAGYLYSTLPLTDCFCAGNVTSIYGTSIGGFAGYCDGPLLRCHSTGYVSGNDYVGGLNGRNWDPIEQCFALGDVEGHNEYVGGLVGRTWGNLTDCYAKGDVTFKGTSGGYTGGLAGGFSGMTATNCYSKGSVSEDNLGASTLGGLVAESVASTAISCYWDTQTSGQLTSAEGTGATTAAMQNQSLYVGWDFTSLWKMRTGIYPQFLLAAFSADVLSGLTPLVVTFTNETSGWPDATAEIVNRNWDFGDGSPDSSDFSPVHTYTTSGNFTVTLVETRNFVDATQVRANYIQATSFIPPFPITGPRYWVSNVDSTWAETANWSNSSGGPGGYSIPANQNVVIFDNGGTGDCDIDAAVDVQGLGLMGYPGVVRQNGYHMQIDRTGALFWTGDFSGSGADIRVRGNVSIGSGSKFLSTDQTLSCDSTFQYYDTGTFNHNDGIVSLDSSGCMVDGSGMVLSTLQFNTTHARMGESCFVNRLLVLNSGSARHVNANRNLFVRGDMSCRSGYDQWTDYNNLSILLDSTEQQSITNEVGCIVPTLSIEKDTTNHTICYGGSPLRIKGDFALYDGTLNTNGLSVQVGY